MEGGLEDWRRTSRKTKGMNNEHKPDTTFSVFRNLAVGACSTNSRLGTIAAPYIVMLVRGY